MASSRQPQPGDAILDRYLSDADEATRERARENLRRFAKALLRITIRQTREELAQVDSRKGPIGAKITTAP